MIGGFNVIGSIFFGWAGQRWEQAGAVGGIYIFRSIALAWYFTLPPTPATTLLFGAIMGFCGWASDRWWRVPWPKCSPEMAGDDPGLAFMSHQVGSFPRRLRGRGAVRCASLLHMAWRNRRSLGLAGGIIQVAFALIRPSQDLAVSTSRL